MSKCTHIPADRADGSDRTSSAILPGAGLVAAIAAFAGASCCVLPLLLASVGVGGAWIAQLSIFVTYRWYILTFALMLIAASWLVAIFRGSSTRARFILAIATALVIAALLMPTYEDDITRQLLKVMRG